MKLNNRNWHLYVYFGLISLITIALELIYPKIIQFMQLYGFETTIIPISMLGLGAGALYAYYHKKSIDSLAELSLYFSITILLAPFLLIYFNNPFFAIIILGVPFFLSSLILTIGYFHFSPFFIYSSQSFGGALGLFVVVILFEPVGAENMLLSFSLIIILFSVIIFGVSTRLRKVQAILFLIFLASLLINIKVDYFNLIRVMRPSGKKFVNYAGNERLKEKDAQLLKSRWSLISRVDLIKERVSIYDSLFGDDITKFKNPDVRETFLDLKGRADYYNLYYNNVIFTFIPYRDKIIWKMPPYTLLDKPEVLIIGLGGGVDIAIAKFNGAKRIVGVEINPAMVHLMKEEQVPLVNTYKDAEVHLMDGRSYVETCKEKFDLIQLMFTELYVPFPNSLAFVENYLYTVEAFKSYFRVLKDDGIIFINKWIGNYESPTELLRITTTAYEALRQIGVKNPESNFIIVGYYISGWRTNGGYVLIKKTPFKISEILKVKESLGEPMYLLYTPEDRELNNPFSAFFKESDINSFYERSPYNISPTYDDKPYLNLFDKKFREHKKLLLHLLIISSVLLLFILLNLKEKLFSSARMGKLLFAIIFIATGYIWVELILIQKFNILLGSPVLSMGIILVSYFFGNGIGSYTVSRVGKGARRVFIGVTPIILFALYSFLPEIISSLLSYAFVWKVLAGILVGSLSGFFLGIPFPVILKSIGDFGEIKEIPLFVSFDGVISVLGVGFAMFLSAIYGFNILLLISAFLYIPPIILLLVRK